VTGAPVTEVGHRRYELSTDPGRIDRAVVHRYLCDVFVLPEHQDSGLGRALVTAIVEHPDVVNVKWQFLATADAHELYEPLGFTALDEPGRWMHRRRDPRPQ
jgi:GNAT superfamily N-acetyltransferase